LAGKSSNNRVCRSIEVTLIHGEDIDKAELFGDCPTITYLTCPQLEVGWGMEFSFMTGRRRGDLRLAIDDFV